MNAVVMQPVENRSNTVRSLRNGQFLTLLKREFWEHRGGIFWAPVVLAIIQIVVSLVTFTTAYFKFKDSGPGDITINGVRHEFAIVNLGDVLTKLSPNDLAYGGRALDLFYYASSMWPLIVAGIVAFFYALASIFDERKDRSLLFWKSMPVSETQTVLSKVITAVVVIPGVAMLVSAALVLIYATLGSLLGMLFGISPSVVWQHSHPFKVIGSVFASLPIHAIWALPAAGWLMLCSAYSRRAPFLWALGVPLIVGLGVLWMESGVSLGSSVALSEGYFSNVVYRILPSIIPGSFITALGSVNIDPELGLMPYSLPVVGQAYAVLLKPQAWLGILAAAVMFWATIRQRRISGVL